MADQHTVAPGEGQHSHGAGANPDERLTKRIYSRDPDVFGTPTGREEDWRFTPVDRLRGLLNPVNPDGKLVVEVRSPEDVSTRYVDRDDPLVGSVLTPSDRVSALALAGVEQALVVSVPRGAVPGEPVYLTVRGDGGTQYGHLVIDVAAGAEATVVVDHVGSGIVASNTEYRVGDGAGLTVLSLQDWDDDAVHVEAQVASLGRDARLRHIVVTLGGDLVRISPTVRFAGPGGDAELLGLSFTDAGQHQEHRVFVDHAAPNCRSRVTYKGALQGQDAHVVWIGDVLIPPAGTGTDTYELNRNLLLTDGARADSVPNLEITTGEVRGAGHASATGRFDDLQLFYLMSRGIPAREARRMVVRAFFADVIGRIGLPGVQERLTAAIEDELAAVGGEAG
jgi:Fe-S cluster assembly protein SufD